MYRFEVFTSTPGGRELHEFSQWASRSRWLPLKQAHERMVREFAAAGSRVLGIDYGQRRIGLAISDATRTIARPLTTLTVAGARDALARVTDEIARLMKEEDGLSAIVVGLPVRLDGSPNDQTARVRVFIAELASATPLPIAAVDERLTSREADERLAVGERDWKARKKKLDAAAAAVFLQDYLDQQGGYGR